MVGEARVIEIQREAVSIAPGTNSTVPMISVWPSRVCIASVLVPSNSQAQATAVHARTKTPWPCGSALLNECPSVASFGRTIDPRGRLARIDPRYIRALDTFRSHTNHAAVDFRTIYRLAFATLVIAVFVACMVPVPEGLMVFSWQDKLEHVLSFRACSPWLSRLVRARRAGCGRFDVLWWFDRNRAVADQLAQRRCVRLACGYDGRGDRCRPGAVEAAASGSATDHLIQSPPVDRRRASGELEGPPPGHCARSPCRDASPEAGWPAGGSPRPDRRPATAPGRPCSLARCHSPETKDACRCFRHRRKTLAHRILGGHLGHVEPHVGDLEHVAAAQAVPGSMTQSWPKATGMPAASISGTRVVPRRLGRCRGVPAG